MARAKNEAPKALRGVEREEVSPSPHREGCGEVTMPPPQTFFSIFELKLASFGAFW